MTFGAILDGDDTLWVTEPLYDIARSAAGAVVRAAGLDEAAWDAAQRTIDVANVAVLGLSAARFPTSCVQAYELVAQETDRPVEPDVAAQVRSAAAAVFDERAPLVDGVAEVLTSLGQRGPLALLTKGDPEVQAKRIADSGLSSHFAVIEIVSAKDAGTFRALADQLGLLAADCWSIGNSLGSDIVPAVEAGLRGVWIDAHVWEYERARQGDGSVPPGAVVAHHLRDVPAVIEQAPAGWA